MTAPTRTTLTPGQTVTKRHPIRGFLWGLMMGLGLAVVAVVIKVMTLSLTNVIVMVAIGVVFGIVWGLFGPEKAPSGPAPAARTVVIAEASRFDDFDKPKDYDDDYHEPLDSGDDDATGNDTDDATND